MSKLSWLSVLVITMGLMLPGGCSSAVRELGTVLGDVHARTMIVRESLVAVRAALEEDNVPKAIEHLDTADESALAIQKSCTQAMTLVGKVENRQTAASTFWMTVAKWWWVGLILACLLVAKKYGLDAVIRPMMQQAGRWVDSNTKRDAELDAKQAAGRITHAEAVAARRAMRGVGYEAIYRDEVKRLEVPASPSAEPD